MSKWLRGLFALLILLGLWLALSLSLPRHFSLERSVALAAESEWIVPYLIQTEKQKLWSPFTIQVRSAAPDTEIQAAFRLSPEWEAQGRLHLSREKAGQQLRITLNRDARWNFWARYHTRRLERETGGQLDRGLAKLKALAEADAEMAAAQRAATADSVAHVPLDTLSTEVQTPE